MTTAQLFAQLRTQLQDANKPGLAGVRALEGTAQTVDALEDAVKLVEQRGATREAARYGEMLRHMSGGDPAKVYEAEQAVRVAKPELWAGVLMNLGSAIQYAEAKEAEYSAIDLSYSWDLCAALMREHLWNPDELITETCEAFEAKHLGVQA